MGSAGVEPDANTPLNPVVRLQPCEKCGVGVGLRCRRLDGHIALRVHKERLNDYLYKRKETK